MFVLSPMLMPTIESVNMIHQLSNHTLLITLKVLLRRYVIHCLTASIKYLVLEKVIFVKFMYTFPII